MKELLKELVKLAVMTVIVMAAFFGLLGFVVLMLKGITFLPPYIGEFGTFMLYVAFYLLVFAGIKYFSKND